PLSPSVSPTSPLSRPRPSLSRRSRPSRLRRSFLSSPLSGSFRFSFLRCPRISQCLSRPIFSTPSRALSRIPYTSEYRDSDPSLPHLDHSLAFSAASYDLPIRLPALL